MNSLNYICWPMLFLFPMVNCLIVRNETSITDFGTTTHVNQSRNFTDIGANYTTDDMVETSCHIISEQLVATATATVSSAFSDLCRTDAVTKLLAKLEEKLLGELKLSSEKIDKILKHFMITEGSSGAPLTSS